MYTTLNLFLSFFTFHQFGVLINNGPLFMTINKIVSAMVLCAQYLLYNKGESFLIMKPLFTSFFLYDICYILFYIKKTITYKVLLFHHCVLIITSLVEHQKAYPLIEFFFFVGEISNIFMYFQYLLIKYSNNKNLISYFNTIETVSYIFLRIIIITYVFNFENVVKLGYSFYYCWFPLYIMGILWSYKLVSSTIKKCLKNQ